MTPDERRDHVLELTDELGAMIVVDEDELRGMYPTDCTTEDPCGYAYGPDRPFKGAPKMPPIIVLSHDPGKSHAAYLVALHELGHVGTDKDSKLMLEREALAWRWAVDRALEGPTAEGWRYIASALRSYTICWRCKPSTNFDRLLKQAERRARV